MCDNETVTKEDAEYLLKFVTEHERTSCSDDNLYNAYLCKNYTTPTARCGRCLLLARSRDEYYAGPDFSVNVTLVKRGE